MKHYFRNLWLALTGDNAYQLEIDEKSSQLTKATENIHALQEQYFAALQKWEQESKVSAGLQRLVENLRKRIEEKDAEAAEVRREFQERMEHMKADYQKRIVDYNKKVDELKSLLP